jgi:hypothetical protein
MQPKREKRKIIKYEFGSLANIKLIGKTKTGTPIIFAEMQRRKPTDIWMELHPLEKRNPNKITFITMQKGLDKLALFTYKDNPKQVFISLNNEFFPLRKEELKSWYVATIQALKFLKKAEEKRE